MLRSRSAGTQDGPVAGPAAVFFHGGGYVFGHIDQFDGPVARHVSQSGVPFLSVEYQLGADHVVQVVVVVGDGGLG
ncbi:alpha/beta hydrolase fold domain-containing protein [Nocardiopsis sp. Huas11]|uniref:alpha/beta hydrolase fold domain-containing protein n=1 Tax=Nocardiopsis sp. Huas11 TaxID=2183912 RepID=UPI000EADDAE9